MNAIVNQQKKVHGLIVRALDEMSEEQLTRVPDGHRNNILWNAGHIIVAHQVLLYHQSGLDMAVSADMVAQFRRGSSPADWEQTPDVSRIRSLLLETPERLAEDLAAGRFKTFTEYTTQSGIPLTTFEDALAMNHYHEGLHLGMIMSLRKHV
jgi:hypothetical protein